MTASVRGGTKQGEDRVTDTVFAGPGEMRARCRALDWAATPLGAVEHWPATLRTVVRLMLETPVATSLWCGPSYTLVYNDAYRRILGAKDATALGRSGAEVWDELWPSLEPQFRQVRTGGPAIMAERTLLRMERLAGGAAEDAWFTYALCALTDDAGQCLAVYNTAVEVTGRILAERELAAERERLRAVIRNVPAPVALHLGPEHRISILSEAFREVSAGRDITGMTPQEAYPEAVGQGVLERFDDVFRTGQEFISPETYVRFNRRGLGIEDTWIDIRYLPVRDHDGRVVGVLNFSFDVTAQVEARRYVERLLADSERARAESAAAAARFEAVLASIADAFYLLDREWRFTYVNDAAEPLLQTTREKLLGRTLWEAFPGVIGSPFEGPYREAMATGRVTAAEAYFPPLATWFDVRTYPWTGGLMVHFRDIGERKAAEVERERLLADAHAARAEAEKANRAKSEFLAVMSHELRTPLNAIGGYAELMEMGIRGPVTPQQAEDLRRVQASQRHLLGLVNEVLNYAKLETGTVHFDLEAVNAREALAAAESLVAPQAQAKGITMTTTDCAPELAVKADAEKLRQILVNLLSNAVKFTASGGRIALSCASAGALLHVAVQDTGIGIPIEQQARIFDPFVQVRADLTRTAEGTGLGLAISRDLARGMGGDLTVESSVGVGSTFTVALPRA